MITGYAPVTSNDPLPLFFTRSHVEGLLGRIVPGSRPGGAAREHEDMTPQMAPGGRGDRREPVRGAHQEERPAGAVRFTRRNGEMSARAVKLARCDL
jgi:hypothetical protein